MTELTASNLIITSHRVEQNTDEEVGAGDLLVVRLEAHSGDDLTEDGDVEDQESDEEIEGALGVMGGHTVLGDSSDEALAEEVYQEPSDVINDAIDLKEVIEIIEGSEDTFEDIIDIDID